MHNIGLNNLGTSLFERILKVCKQNYWNAFAMLQEQSRMSEDIMRLANNLSYQNKLKASDYAPDSNIHKVSDSSHSSIITKSNCIFIDTKLEPFSTKTNFSEVEIIIDLIAEVKMLYGESFNQKTLGIISPWRRQCNEILNRLSDIDKQIITVDTVERFQGSEREVIIFSAATNNLHLLDLLSESKLIDDELVDRKLNVAITRAKHKFILLGNYELLCKKEVYRKLIKQIIER
ncbi:hypothetical protein SDC9_135686 [bioreactor metagenome]|uniref:DNA2/NAM7 helicase-like C-terminal domain-containing protein n=1 Tax=bioreactor metagenome TaxID=1076179 RepID=A0A645DJ19_9ZZZZ